MLDSKLRASILAILRSNATAIALGATGIVGGLSATPVHAQTASPATPNDGLEEIVVTGQRAALESAQQFKQNASEIVDSIVAEDIGKLPDRSVTEVLQRIVGVTIDHTYRDIAGNTDPEHFQVEGAGVAVRGLSYVRSEINGRDSFTANGGRALSFDDVPPELMAAIDVYKNPSAEQIEGAVGGLVNLRTAMPFDFKGLHTSASIGGTWGDLSRGQVKPQISGLISDHWDTPIGEFGALLDVAYSESMTRTDGIETSPFFPRVSSLEPTTSWIPAGQTVWVPDGFSWRTLRYKRTREGIYGALQWRPTENLETELTVFRSTYKFHWDEDAIFSQTNPYNITPAAGTSFTTAPNGMLTSGVLTDPADSGMPDNDDVRSADRHSNTTDVAWKTRWHVTDRLKLTTDVQLVRASTLADDFTVATGVNVPSQTVSLGNGTGIPNITVDPAFLTNPANYYWAFTMDGLSRSDGKEWSWREDADFTIGDGFFKSIRAGVRWSDRSAFTDVSEPGNGYNWQAVSQTWMLGWYEPNLAYLNQFPAPTSTYGFPNFFNGRVGLPSAVVFPATSLATGWPATFQTLQGFRATLCAQLNPSCNYVFTPAAFGPASNGGINTQDERTYAGYFTVQFGGNVGSVPFDGGVGVRIVKTSDRADGYISMPAFVVPSNQPGGIAFPGFALPETATQSFTNVLPSLNIRFHLTDQLQARLAVAKALARPDFSQLQAFTTFSSSISSTGVQSFTGTANGNPYLKPTTSDQIDGTLEWYFAKSGSLTGAVFYKKLHDVVVNQLIDTTVTDAAGNPHTFATTGPINGANGDLKGFEIAYQQYFDFLPNLLKGLGGQLNYTYVDSHRTLKTPVTGKYCDSGNGTNDTLNVNLNGCDTNGQTFGDLPLQNLSRNAFNVAMLYDRGPVSARLAYSWRSKYLMGVNVNSANGTNGLNTDPASPNLGQQNLTYGLPVWGDSYGELDGSIFYNFTQHFTVGFTATNITDSLYKELMQQHIGMMGHAWYDSGRTFAAQFRVTY
jgi:TonB-dependent receptor